MTTQYFNAGGCAGVAEFDDDLEPIGPMLRKELIPTYIIENADRKLVLTQAGKKELDHNG